MKALKDQIKKMINSEEINNQTNIDNNYVREKIKKLIKKKNYNLRDLSRNIKKNDAYLQQYLYRGTPKVLPEEYRYLLAKSLNVNVNELIPNWLKDLSTQEQFFILRNIENKVNHINQISFSKELLIGLDFYDVENLYVDKISMEERGLTEEDLIVDVEILNSNEIGEMMTTQDVVIHH